MLEREGIFTFQIPDKGRAEYSIHGDECYISMIYVVPEERQNGVASFMADEIEKIAKEKGCLFLTGSVVPSLKGATESALAMIKAGFDIHSSRDNFIVFKRRIY